MKIILCFVLLCILLSSNACPLCILSIGPETLTTNSLLEELSRETGEVLGNNMDISAILDNHEPLCKIHGTSESVLLAKRATGLITTILDFVEKNGAVMDDKNVALALAMLKVYDDKHQSFFQRRYKIDGLVSQICSKAGTECPKVTKNWNLIHNPDISGLLLSKEIETMTTSANIGHDRVNLTIDLVAKCESSLIGQCNLDSECRSVFLESPPSTQYVLSHQLLYRMLVQTLGCESLAKYYSGHAEQNFCAKMYMESQLISQFNYPTKQMDLFVENIALCGFRGYANFFRADWFNQILTWQNENPKSCLNHKNSEDAVETKSCDTHFMSVSLVALAGFWDHLQKEC